MLYIPTNNVLFIVNARQIYLALHLAVFFCSYTDAAVKVA